MPVRGTTKQQVGGYRFIIRRMEHALVRRDVRMLDEPMRTQSRSMLVGAVLAMLVLAGFGIAAWISPAPDTDDALILLAQDSGALYVRVDRSGAPGATAGDVVGASGGASGGAAWADTAGSVVLHPALNLASARLVVGRAADPLRVPDGHLPQMQRGAVVGIPGAPQRLPGRGDQVAGPWTVCDVLDHGAAARTAVLVGEPEFRGGSAGDGETAGTGVGQAEAILVTTQGAATDAGGTASERDYYLLFAGVRAPVDPADPGVSRALGLGGVDPVRVSGALLGALPEAPALTAPHVDGAGEPSRFAPDGARVGDILHVERATAADSGRKRGGGEGTRIESYMVLDDGLQAVPAVVADLAVYSGYSGGYGARVHRVQPEDIARVPTTRHPLDLRGFPAGAVRARQEAPQTVCASYGGASYDGASDGGPARWTVLEGAGVTVAGADRPVRLVGSDGAGPGVDEFFLRPGAAAHVAAVGADAAGAVGPSGAGGSGGTGGSGGAGGLDRAERGGSAGGPRFLVADTGVRYGIPDAHTSEVLGLGAPTDAAPWSILRLLPQGPALTRTDALVVHDSIAPDPTPELLGGGS